MNNYVLAVTLLALCLYSPAHGEAQETRECILERKVHIEKDLIREIPQVARLCEEIPNLEKGHVDAGGVRLYCEQEGRGIPIVLLHGGPGATHHHFHPHFSRAKDFARVIYYDQRGCGLSEFKKDTGYTIAQAVKDLHNLRNALKIDKWIVLGHSYGGALAQCYAVKYPEDVAGLILVCSALAAPIKLNPSWAFEFLSKEELQRLSAIRRTPNLSVAQRIYNAFLNGDWKRQYFYRPTQEEMSRIALYEWCHDTNFNAVMSTDLGKQDLLGAFDNCPIPTLIIEGKWDLTWNTDKPKKLHSMHPRAKFVFFERSSHSPFADESAKFFDLLRAFVQELALVTEAQVVRWKDQLAAWQKEREKSPAYLLRTCGYGRKSNQKIAACYSREWLTMLDDPNMFLKLGFALYDTKRYTDALDAFTRMAETSQENKLYLAIALIWQGHMLDLLNRREEAVAAYKRVVAMNITGVMRHDQFGIAYSPSPYAAERLKTPFTRIENREND